MNVIVISSSPNKGGLTAACANAAVEGVRAAGGQAQEIRLNFDFIPVNRWNRAYKLAAIRAAAQAIVQE
ncbi:MAG: hypothetical protein PVF45_04670 [Anaerolineae bacterium]|jgi:multimeric flavodoxin WrbA